MLFTSAWLRAPLAGVLATLLLLSPLAPGLTAMTDEPVKMCSMHGRGCTCPDMCKRGEHGHDQDEPEPEGPACHRKAAPQEKKSDCNMNRCGREEPLVAFSVEPARLAPLSFFAWLPPEAGVLGSPPSPHAVERDSVPPAPPPRLFA